MGGIVRRGMAARLALVTVLGASGFASGQMLPSGAIQAATELRDAALAGTEAHDLLRSLTTEAGQRFAGSPGDAAGVAWGLRTLERLGFDVVFNEEVSVPRWERGEEEGHILTPVPRDVVLAALGGSIGTPESGVEAPVVEFASLEALTEASREIVEGKIAFISDRMERSRDGSGYGKAVRKRGRGAVEASRLGAIAVLIRSAGTSKARFAHTGAMRYDPEVPKIPAAALSNADADVLSGLLEAGEEVTFRLRLTSRHLPEVMSASVFGDIRGSEAPDEIVILACHLDSWDLGHGAVDDGAGCAIVIEAARRIAAHPTRPRRTIRVGLFANEEFGLSGARAYLENHESELESHIIGTESDLGAGRIWRFDSKVQEAGRPVIEQIFEVLEPLGIERGGNEAFGGADLSPMRRAGMPVVSLRQDASRYFDLHHTANDVIDHVDPEDLDQNVAAYVAFAYLAASSQIVFGPNPVEERPTR